HVFRLSCSGPDRRSPVRRAEASDFLCCGFDGGRSAGLDLDLADPRLVGLRNPDLEHAVLEAGFDLIAAHPGAEGERALERAVDALAAMRGRVLRRRPRLAL